MVLDVVVFGNFLGGVYIRFVSSVVGIKEFRVMFFFFEVIVFWEGV